MSVACTSAREAGCERTDERVSRAGLERGLPGAVPRLALLNGGGDPGGLARLGGPGGRDVDSEPGALDEGKRAEAGGSLGGGEALREVDEGRDVGEAAVKTRVSDTEAA